PATGANTSASGPGASPPAISEARRPTSPPEGCCRSSDLVIIRLLTFSRGGYAGTAWGRWKFLPRCWWNREPTGERIKWLIGFRFSWSLLRFWLWRWAHE